MMLHLVGARPNFMKLAPIARAMTNAALPYKVVHSGQHFDAKMSKIFFQELEIREPDHNLGVSSGSHAQQVARTMIELEQVLESEDASGLVIYGDVNATLAGALVASKIGLPIVHVEAGLRSYDRRMPEEINRIVADRLSNVLLTPSLDANENLIREGESKDSIHLVGNIMIDTLVHNLDKTSPKTEGEYGLVTLHRPSNVDDPKVLKEILKSLEQIASDIPLIFPMHPRTRKNLKAWDMEITNDRIKIIDPVGYLDFISYQRYAKFVITDSGGIQEETTYMKVPCLVLRENTERPVTVDQGTGTLIGFDYDRLIGSVGDILNGSYKQGEIPELWDGNTAGRILKVLSREGLS